MAYEWLSRSFPIFGEDGMIKLKKAAVAVVGLGGVGGAACEAVCRAGVGKMIIADFDRIDITNINRQIIALTNSVGLKKTDVMSERLKLINPDIEITAIPEFISEENGAKLFSESPDIVIDAVDSVSAKLYLISECQKRNIPIISCMGTGNRSDPTRLKFGTILDTSGCGCPLARIMRKEASKRNLAPFYTVFSSEPPVNAVCCSEGGKHSPASVSFVPPSAGLIIASKVIEQLLK